MLTIYTGNRYDTVKDIVATYMFPENGVSPWEQLTWCDEHLSEFKEKDVSIVTFSPYILNYMNLLIIRNDLGDEDIAAIEKYMDEDNGEVNDFDLKIYDAKTNTFSCIDTRSLSDPISHIYNLYNIEKNKEKNQE